jgi:hypothetical protein
MHYDQCCNTVASGSNSTIRGITFQTSSYPRAHMSYQITEVAPSTSISTRVFLLMTIAPPSCKLVGMPSAALKLEARSPTQILVWLPETSSKGRDSVSVINRVGDCAVREYAWRCVVVVEAEAIWLAEELSRVQESDRVFLLPRRDGIDCMRYPSDCQELRCGWLSILLLRVFSGTCAEWFP